MTPRERITLAVCIALHVAVLLNVWQMSKLTPRVVHVDRCLL